MIVESDVIERIKVTISDVRAITFVPCDEPIGSIKLSIKKRLKILIKKIIKAIKSIMFFFIFPDFIFNLLLIHNTLYFKKSN